MVESLDKDNQLICKTNGDGNKYWILNGQYHREDGPAIEYTSGSKFWYSHGKLHRLDGPAIEYYNGYKLWYYHDKRVNCSSQEEFERLINLKVLW